MTKVKDVCRHIRSKNAGPFWVTFDFFFKSPEDFAQYHDNPALGAEAFAALYSVDPALVKRFPVPGINVLKISYPRASSQGGKVERDLHSGQQFVPILEVDLV